MVVTGDGDNEVIRIGLGLGRWCQWIFAYDRATQRGELRGGDMGWNSVQSVENG